MSFNQSFEQVVNNDMQDDGQPGRAPPDFEDADMAMKKGLPSPAYPIDEKAREKNQYPPRFSTLYGAAAAPPPPPPPPPPQREYIREYHPAPPRKSGVFLPMPLFIVFAAILFLESTILFAYTVIGLYNNAPARLFPWAGQGGPVATACNCAPQQPTVNIAPNFIMPQAGQPLTEVVTISASQSTTVSSSSTSTTSSSSSTSSSTSTSSTSLRTASDAAAAASNIAGILGGLDSVTASPTRDTVTRVTLITEDPSGKVLTPRPTITQTTTVDPPSSTGTITDAPAASSSIKNAQSSSSSFDSAAWASVSSALAAVEANLTPSPLGGITVTPTTLPSSITLAPTA